MANTPLQRSVDNRYTSTKQSWLVALMSSYFFLVITIFWILKPIKKTLFLNHYQQVGHLDLFGWQLSGSQAELLAKILNMLVAFVAVVVFTTLARKLYRQKLTFVFCAFSIACLGIYSVIAGNASGATVWHFYLFGDLFNTLMVATFFSFLSDSFSPEGAKRAYGLVVLGGVGGGWFGSMFVRKYISEFSVPVWMWICIGGTVVIAIVAYAAGTIVERNPPPAQDNDPSMEQKSNAAVEGAKLVARSRYLLAIVVMVGLYEMVSTILDYQFTRTVVELSDNIGEQFATVYSFTNGFAFFLQLLATSYIMRRFGITLSLLVMPVAIVAASSAYLILPILWVGSALNTVDNGLNYSLNQSARETLYTPTTRDEKYKAKAFIDMFVQRFAKAVAVGLTLLITSVFTSFGSLRWLSLVAILLTVAWIVAARYAGREFQRRTTG